MAKSLEKARITFYDIEKCGLYKYGEDVPRLGNISDFLYQLSGWVKKGNKTLEETCTYSLEQSEDVDRTFCYDLQEKNGDFLLTTWNETPSYKGKVAAVKKSSTVGNATVEFTTLPKDSIPGYATYFWFIPSKNVFATVRFQHRLNGKRNLDRYMREYISKLSDFVVWNSGSGSEISVLGYSAQGSDKIENLSSSFLTSIRRKPGSLKYIMDNSIKIRKVTRHNKLIPSNKPSLELWQKFLLGLGLTEKKTLSEEVKFSYEFNMKPTKGELKQIIDEWTRDHDSKWDDIGFTFIGDQTPFWLSQSVSQDTITIEIERINEEIVTAKSLLKALAQDKDKLLRLL